MKVGDAMIYRHESKGSDSVVTIRSIDGSYAWVRCGCGAEFTAHRGDLIPGCPG